MKFDPTKPVQTSSGYPARIISTDVKGAYSIVALLDGENGEVPHLYNSDGKFYTNETYSLDLVNVPEKKTVRRYINLYPDLSLGDGSNDAETAKKRRGGRPVLACIEIDITTADGKLVSASFV